MEIFRVFGGNCTRFLGYLYGIWCILLQKCKKSVFLCVLLTTLSGFLYIVAYYYL